ncbi:MAG: hypothetical protein M3O78_07100 [Chloroflexota bacterium]|nr:hypothetical protein [Chloroflexota bacterium]
MERHPVDLLSLIAGALVLGLGLLLLSGGLSGLRMEWAGPAVAIGLGVVIIAAVRPERGPSADDSQPNDEA